MHFDLSPRGREWLSRVESFMAEHIHPNEARFDRELLLWERQEEFVICAAEDKSQTLPRRVTADPRAVLGLTIRGLGLWKAKAA